MTLVCDMQRTFAIWGFALKFVFKYWLLGRKFTYGKKVAPTMFFICACMHDWFRHRLCTHSDLLCSKLAPQLSACCMLCDTLQFV